MTQYLNVKRMTTSRIKGRNTVGNCLGGWETSRGGRSFYFWWKRERERKRSDRDSQSGCRIQVREGDNIFTQQIQGQEERRMFTGDEDVKREEEWETRETEWKRGFAMGISILISLPFICLFPPLDPPSLSSLLFPLVMLTTQSFHSSALDPVSSFFILLHHQSCDLCFFPSVTLFHLLLSFDFAKDLTNTSSFCQQSIPNWLRVQSSDWMRGNLVFTDRDDDGKPIAFTAVDS